MQLAGVHHITVSPPLLAELAATAIEGWRGRESIGWAHKEAYSERTETETRVWSGPESTIPGDESAWRLAFTRSGAGRNEVKIIQAINIFADMQERLEEMLRKFRTRA